MSQAPTQFLLTNEAARIIGVSPQTIRLWENVGRLRAVKASGGVRLFDRHDVEQLRDSRDESASSVVGVR